MLRSEKIEDVYKVLITWNRNATSDISSSYATSKTGYYILVELTLSPNT
jgi:hypothetical protein